jgi:ATP-dependent RNA helicase RhlE
MTFRDLALAEPVLQAIATEGYSVPTPIQAQAVPHILEGKDLLGTAQTGTGKTAAFALPIISRLLNDPSQESHFRKPRVLIVSPTRELASQIGDSFNTYGYHTALRQAVVYGGVSQVPQVRLLRRGVDIVIATPGRLLDLFNQGCLKLDAVSILVLDEADRMLDMGFMPAIRQIVGEIPKNRQTLLFSATMPREIEKLARELLRDPVQVRIAPVQQTTDLVTQSVFHVPHGQKPLALAAYLKSRPVERAVVFTRTKQAAERVATRLSKAGVSADAIHGNKTQAARQRTLMSFRNNRTMVLVATDVAARGLDVDGISHVVNYDLPTEPETYVHRIGRTGRAGATGIAISFCDGEQRGLLRGIERLLNRKLPIEQVEFTDESSLPATSPPRIVSEADAQALAPAESKTDAPRERRFERRDRDDRRPHQGGYSGERRQGGPPRDHRPGGYSGERRPYRDRGDRPQYGARGGYRSMEGAPQSEGATGNQVENNQGEAGPQLSGGAEERPRFNGGGDRPRYNGGGKPRYNGGGQGKPRYNGGSNDRPRYNGERKPRYEGGSNQEGGERPRQYGNGYRKGGEGRPGQRPRYEGQADRPRSSGDGERPRYNREAGDRPRRDNAGGERGYKGGEGRPRQGGYNQDRPRSGGEYGQGRPRNGGASSYGRKPEHNRPPVDKVGPIRRKEEGTETPISSDTKPPFLKKRLRPMKKQGIKEARKENQSKPEGGN